MILDILDIPAKFPDLLNGWVLVDGAFDPIHEGHIDYFQQSKKFGLPVACLLAPDTYTENKHQVLVFSQYVKFLAKIKACLDRMQVKYQYIDGSTPAKQRKQEVDRFQAGESDVFLLSLKAGGTGLNLTQADYVYIIDPWWNPAVENQAIDRCYRIGQEKHVVAVRLICPGTIEEKIMDLQQSKRTLADDLIQTDTSILKSLKQEDLLSLLD